MASHSAIFSDLSPAKRQLLFEKIRQKKLNQARRPTIGQHHGQSDEAIVLTPYQIDLLQNHDAEALPNRLVEIEFTGYVVTDNLNSAVAALSQAFVMLQTYWDSATKSFAFRADNTSNLIQQQSLDSNQQDEQLEKIRQELVNASVSQQSIHIRLASFADDHHALLVAAHPLLLDAYSSYRLANYLISLATDSVSAESLIPEKGCTQQHFARWSEQTLEKPFLRKEWARVSPNFSLKSEPSELTAAPAVLEKFIAIESLNRHLSPGISVKQKICNSLHLCLSHWLAHQETTYWFSDPQLKADEFESLLGYFPYYVPVKKAAATDSLSAQLSQLHTRFSPVSEQLAQQLTKSGVPVPLVHYHWLELVSAEPPTAQVIRARHTQSGMMLSAIEIHITETALGVHLDMHFDPVKLSEEQVNYLLCDLMATIQSKENNTTESRKNLPDQLRGIWQDLLQRTEIEPEANFFELGGHSLQVTEMKFRIKQQLKLDIPISVIYELPTVNALSHFITATYGNSLGFTAPGSELEAEMEEQEEGTL